MALLGTTHIRQAFRFRLEPTSTQRQAFVQAVGARRFVWNHFLRRRKEVFADERRTLSVAEMCRELTDLKRHPDTSWLADLPAQMLQQPIRDLDRAFRNFFEGRARFPRFRSKKSPRQSVRFPAAVRVEDNTVVLPKIGRVRMRRSQAVPGTVKSATIRFEAGHWYISIGVDLEAPDLRGLPIDERRSLGIDLGLIDLAVLSTGEKVPAPRPLRRAQQKLGRAHRELARKRLGSRNRAKARRRVARLHARVANIRRDFLHNVTTKLTRAVDVIAIEDLSIRGLARTKCARSIHDAAWGELVRQFEYKMAWLGRRLVRVDRFFPSTKRCRACHRINQELRLSDRTWRCECGANHDRDVNAAKNILDEGLRVLGLPGATGT